MQETWHDAKDVVDTEKFLGARRIAASWSPPGPTKGSKSGTMVSVAYPLVKAKLFEAPLDTEMAATWESTRLCGCSVQTDGKYKSVGVISFFGVSGSNAVEQKRLDTERKLLALVTYLHHLKDRPLIICMDSNLSREKSQVMEAMEKLDGSTWLVSRTP